MDLSTTYLGLRLAHPFLVGASPLADHLDTVRRLEDGGSAAIVLRSLFEEQITLARSGEIHHMDAFDERFARALVDFPLSDRYALRPDEYLEHLRRIKDAVHVPVIASLNGMTTESWLTFARHIEQAGADALEVNLYAVAAAGDESSLSIETELRDVVAELKRGLKIPVAVKLPPFFTAFAHLAQQLDKAAADGLILFNRFYEPDIDIQSLTISPALDLSTSAELRLRLHWLAVLHGRVRASLALTGGVETPTDGIKALLAGADAVQLVSAILRHGPPYFLAMRDGLVRWMESKQFGSLAEVRGRLSVAGLANPATFERANYIRTLQSWAPEHVVAAGEVDAHAR